MSNQSNQNPGAPSKPIHIGDIVRSLREVGLTRHQLEEATGVSAATIRNLEMARHRPTAQTLRKLLRAPCMATLPEKAKEAGLSLDLGDSKGGRS